MECNTEWVWWFYVNLGFVCFMIGFFSFDKIEKTINKILDALKNRKRHT